MLEGGKSSWSQRRKHVQLFWSEHLSEMTCDHFPELYAMHYATNPFRKYASLAGGWITPGCDEIFVVIYQFY
jgi:hypothetical protein